MNKRLWILAAVLLLVSGIALADAAPTSAVADATDTAACQSTPVDFDKMTADEIQQFADEHGVIIEKTGGGLPSCGANPRRCANGQGGCTPSGPCSYSDTGLTACEADDGWSIQCKYGQTVHIRTCECEASNAPCFGTDLRLICQ